MKFITLKERRKAEAVACNSGSEKGEEFKSKIQLVSCPLYVVSSVTKVIVIQHGLCLKINYPTDLEAAVSLFEDHSRCLI